MLDTLCVPDFLKLFPMHLRARIKQYALDLLLSVHDKKDFSDGMNLTTLS